MKATLTLFLGTLVVVAGITPATLPKTDVFRSRLLQLQAKGTTLTGCLTKVTRPLSQTSKFANNVQDIHKLIGKIQGRISSTDTIIKTLMAIPYVGTASSPVLAPISTVLRTINRGLKTVTGRIDNVVGVIKSWLSPLKTIQDQVAKANGNINKVINIFTRVDLQTQKVVNCLNHLPEGLPKQKGAAALEKVCGTLDHIPKAVASPVDRVTGACTQLEHFMSKLHLVRRKRGLPSLNKVKNALEKIQKAFGPVGKFLDKVKNALDKKICLIGSFLKLGTKVISTIGGKVVNIGKALISKAGSSIKKGFKKVFGRRSTDGHNYIIVDSDFDTHKRGLDFCFTIKKVLKAVKGVTGGMIREAQKYIGKLFTGKLGLKIPGLSSDVLKLNSVLKVFNIPIPDVTSSLKLGGSYVIKALGLNPVQQYIDAVPQCKAVFTTA